MQVTHEIAVIHYSGICNSLFSLCSCTRTGCAANENPRIPPALSPTCTSPDVLIVTSLCCCNPATLIPTTKVLSIKYVTLKGGRSQQSVSIITAILHSYTQYIFVKV